MLWPLLFLVTSIVVGQDHPIDIAERPPVFLERLPILERSPDRFFNVDFTGPVELNNLFSELFTNADLRGGIVYGWNEDIYTANYLLRPHGSNVKDILSAFSAATGYGWNEDNGLINIYPQGHYTFLDTQIEKFKVKNASPREFRLAILEAPEVKAYLKQNQLLSKIPNDPHGYVFSFWMGRAIKEDLITMDRENISVHEILDEAVRQRKSNSYWTYIEYQRVCDGKPYTLFRLGGFLAGPWEFE